MAQKRKMSFAEFKARVKKAPTSNKIWGGVSILFSIGMFVWFIISLF